MITTRETGSTAVADLGDSLHVPGEQVSGEQVPGVQVSSERAQGSVRFRTAKKVLVRLLGLTAATILVIQLISSWDTVTAALSTAVAALSGTGLLWMTVALLAAAGSLLGFAALRATTLRAASVRAPFREVAAVTCAAGALSTTLPGGAVFSTAYTFRKFRSWGASSAAVTWSLTITGVLSALALGMVTGGAGLLSGSTSVLGIVVQSGLLLGALVGAVLLARSPGRLLPLASAVLRRVNRLRRRPAETGLAGLRRAVDDLSAIRPTTGRLSTASGWGLVNILAEIVCLAACLAAVGVSASWSAVLLTYVAGKVVTSISPIPGGFGLVESAMVVGLTTAGVATAPAMAAVLLYRLALVGTTVAAGWTAYARTAKPAPELPTPATAPHAKENTYVHAAA